MTVSWLVSWCSEPSQPHSVISGLTVTELFCPSLISLVVSVDVKHHVYLIRVIYLVSWCFESSQPHRVISGTELVS